MQTTAVSAPTTTATTIPSTGRGTDSLSSEDFYKILVTELRNQDPFEPTKTADMVSQVSQIRGIELSSQLSTVLTQLSSQQRVGGASELLGKYVTATVKADNGTTRDVSGIVTGVRFDASGGAVLDLDTGESVQAADVTRITTPDAVHAAQAAGTGSTTSTNAQNTGATDAAKTPSSTKPRSSKLLPGLSLNGIFHL